MSRLLKSIALTTSLALFSAGTAWAADPVQQHNSNAVWFENWIGLSNASMVVAAPNGKITEIFAKSGTPVFELQPGEVQDGVYRYELRAATEEKQEIVNPIDNGRGELQTESFVPFYRTGAFFVERGVIVTPKEVKEEEG
ncbi:hypothetical protein PVW51_20640 [Sulfitobacter sp. PR48]|jgi:hypothetical protein|nr:MULTISPECIES: hypothetical protein [unclassified Sulfitobacter]MCZ4257690.1 hypothetical protein [Sulfitobacter sp. G21635-S1]MDD9723120.1 hypothetical protein [Sulfitobacter sp. PR48]GLT09877.1 hypothetical protein GCM10007928_21090 [Sulfitobacter porphyrae]